MVAVLLATSLILGAVLWGLDTYPLATASFRFDDLGGGSAVIQVYPGVTTSITDRAPNGTFLTGQTTTAHCRTTGRTVHSHPELGERDRTSDVWLQVDGQAGQTSYATLVYGVIDEVDLSRLSQCRNMP